MLAGLGGAVLLFGLTGLYFAGATGFLSPGDLAAEHAPVDLQCAQCHATGLTSGGVMDLRCERCHDIGGSERLTTAGHVLFGSANAPDSLVWVSTWDTEDETKSIQVNEINQEN